MESQLSKVLNASGSLSLYAILWTNFSVPLDHPCEQAFWRQFLRWRCAW